MSEDIKKIEITVKGDWWYFAGMVEALADQAGNRMLSGGFPYLITMLRGDTPIGEIAFYGEAGTTRIVARPAAPEYAELWRGTMETIHDVAENAADARRTALGRTPDEIIEHYYRSRAAGSKVTLKQLAESSGLSYSYLTKRKMAYDRAGKWGSKVKETVKTGNDI